MYNKCTTISIYRPVNNDDLFWGFPYIFKIFYVYIYIYTLFRYILRSKNLSSYYKKNRKLSDTVSQSKN